MLDSNQHDFDLLGCLLLDIRYMFEPPVASLRHTRHRAVTFRYVTLYRSRHEVP